MPTDDLSPEDRLRLQNELDAAALEQDFGAVFGFGESLDFTPEMEAEFLARVRALESGGRASYVPIGDLVPNATTKSANASAKRGEHKAAIETMLKGLLEAGVATAQPDWITDEAFYRFLVGDFFAHTVPPPPPPDEPHLGDDPYHVVYVDYDQVRSDSPNYMASVTEAFLVDLLNAGEPFSGDYLARVCRDGSEVVDRDTARRKIRAWKEQWTEIVPVGFAPVEPMHGPDGTLYFQFGCAYHVTRPTGEVVEYESPGVMQLALENGEFRVVGCAMDGFKM